MVDAALPILALLLILALLIGGGTISPEAWIEGGCLAVLLLAGCIAFALWMAAHD